MNKSGDLPVGPRVPGPNATLQHVVGMILPSPRAIDWRRASHSACQAGTRLTILASYRAYPLHHTVICQQPRDQDEGFDPIVWLEPIRDLRSGYRTAE